ncbi:MAG: TRCF domain-containing protein, partial [Nanoarchaeota archaeon]|nr:TRCF domain-containing protein [Nanoarchaeota archaeon]
GRGCRKAFAYLFYPQWLDNKSKVLSIEEMKELVKHGKYLRETGICEKAKKRLSALSEFGELGSGFRLALRDLEIRGAGELLGLKQHGFINEVGLSLYCELLSDEVKRIKGITVKKVYLASLDLKVAAFIPENYLPDETERLNYYKRLIDADERNSEKIIMELEDICGTVPESVKNIAEIMSIRAAAGEIGIRHMDFSSKKNAEIITYSVYSFSSYKHHIWL